MNDNEGAQKLIIDMGKIKSDVEKKLNNETLQDKEDPISDKYLLTGIPGFDDLFDKGIPRGSNVIVAGSAGSGKTIFTLQTLVHHAKQGKNCLYLSFEESKEQLINHMIEFGWEPEKLIENGHLKINMHLTSDIYYDKNKEGEDLNAMIAKDSDSLLMDLKPLTIQENMGFIPDIIVLDSLTAISSTFIGKEHSYRFYLERLFKYFKGIGATTLLITEIPEILGTYSSSGIEEFLADGVIVLYNLRSGNIRESAIEILKMRGVKHQKKIVAMQITNKGITVYPDLEVFGDIHKK